MAVASIELAQKKFNFPDVIMTDVIFVAACYRSPAVMAPMVISFVRTRSTASSMRVAVRSARVNVQPSDVERTWRAPNAFSKLTSTICRSVRSRVSFGVVDLAAADDDQRGGLRDDGRPRLYKR